MKTLDKSLDEDEELHYTIKPQPKHYEQPYQEPNPQPVKEAEGLEQVVEKEERKGLNISPKVLLGLGAAGIIIGVGTGGAVWLIGGAACTIFSLYYSRKKKR